jgi:hypothetical protein
LGLKLAKSLSDMMMPPKRRYYSDDFQTPAIAVKLLIPFLKKEWTIWECAQGKGNIVRYLKENGFKVIGTDILTGFDFLTQEPNFNFDCIVTNPPYSLKDEFLARAYSFNKPFAFLMPITALEGKRRQELYKKYGLQLIIPNKRINFETPSGKGSGSWFASAWFTYKFNLPKDIMFGVL